MHMFQLKKKYGEYTVDIHLTTAPVANQGNQFIFGFPLNFDEIGYKTFLAQNLTTDLKGNWLSIEEKEDRICLVTDLTGGFRIYKIQIGCTIYISDDYLWLLEQSGLPIEKNRAEYAYWKKHGYCTGGRTFVRGLDKLKPATMLSISVKGFAEAKLFQDLATKPKIDKYTKEVEADLNDTFACLARKKATEKIILLFSGSPNTVLLAKLMQVHELDFVAVFLQTKKEKKVATQKMKRAKTMANQLGIPLQILTVEQPNRKTASQEILQGQLFDRIDSPKFYNELNAVVQAYGQHIMLVHGQHAKELFASGLSEDYVAYLKRYGAYRKDSFTKMAIRILSFLHKKRFSLPRNGYEEQLAKLDKTLGCSLIDQAAKPSYTDYLRSLIEEQAMHHYHLGARLMYQKLYSVLQGSDQQTIVQAAKYHGVKGVLFPFASAKIIYSILVNQDGKRELAKPNYCIKNILEKYGIAYGEKFGILEKIKPIYQLLSYHRAFKEKEPKGLTKLFFKAAEQLLATPIDSTRFIDKTSSKVEATNPIEVTAEAAHETDHSGTFQFEYAN